MSTSIEWTEETWNPVTGCDKVSPGCKNCYAEVMAKRLKAMGQANYANGFALTLQPHMLEIPLKRQKPTKYFVNSMSDLFHKDIPDEYIDKVFAVMALCSQHTFQVLTKRPERMKEYVNEIYSNEDRLGDIGSWAATLANSPCADYIVDEPLPFKNIHLGVSVENQKATDERIPLLLETPSAIRFLSCEPLLSEINLPLYYCCNCFKFTQTKRVNSGKDCGCSICGCYKTGGWKPSKTQGIDWVIAGGESGPKARPVHPDWIRSIRDQCVSANIPFFFKQFGEYREATPKEIEECKYTIAIDGREECGYYCEEELGHIDHNTAFLVRVGKKKAGRVLDGREWSEFPKV